MTKDKNKIREKNTKKLYKYFASKDKYQIYRLTYSHYRVCATGKYDIGYLDYFPTSDSATIISKITKSRVRFCGLKFKTLKNFLKNLPVTSENKQTRRSRVEEIIEGSNTSDCTWFNSPLI